MVDFVMGALKNNIKRRVVASISPYVCKFASNYVGKTVNKMIASKKDHHKNVV